ncbi:MAG: addiction module protein, partial [Myxococcota bacterium]
MTEQAQALLTSALRLSAEERAKMAAELLASLDDEPDEDVEALWAAEITRRAERVMKEGSRGVTWDELRDELR